MSNFSEFLFDLKNFEKKYGISITHNSFQQQSDTEFVNPIPMSASHRTFYLETRNAGPTRRAQPTSVYEPKSIDCLLNHHRALINKSSGDKDCSTPEVIQHLLAIEASHNAAINYERQVKAAMDQLKMDISCSSKDFDDNNNIAFTNLLHQNESSLKEFNRLKEHQSKVDLGALFNLCISGLMKDADEPLNQTDTYHYYYVCLAALLGAIKSSSGSEEACSVFKAGQLSPSIITELAQSFTIFVNNIVSYVASDMQKLSRSLFQQNTFSQTRSAENAETYEQCRVNRFHYGLNLLQRLLSEDFIPGLGLQVCVSTMDELLTALIPFWLMEHQSGGFSYKQCLSFSSESSFLPALLTVQLRQLHQLSAEPLKMIENLFGTVSSGESQNNDNLFLDGSKKQAIDLARWLLYELWSLLRSMLNCIAKLPPEKLASILTATTPNEEDSAANCTTLNQLFLQLQLLCELYKEVPSQDNSYVLFPYQVQEGWCIIKLLIRLLKTSLGDNIWNYFDLVDKRYEDNQSSKEMVKNIESVHHSQGLLPNQPKSATEKSVSENDNASDSSSFSNLSNFSTDDFEVITMSNENDTSGSAEPDDKILQSEAELSSKPLQAIAAVENRQKMSSSISPALLSRMSQNTSEIEKSMNKIMKKMNHIMKMLEN